MCDGTARIAGVIRRPELTLPISAILFDLDDTLLGNDIDAFMKSYLPLLAGYVSSYIDRDSFVKELMNGTQAMIGSCDPALTNADVFWTVFSERTGLDRAIFEPYVDKFYRYEFSKLQPLTSRQSEAVDLIGYCFQQGYRVVIATNPLFPKTAIKQRLNWAGIPESKYKYDLVTSYENMHSTKPRAEDYNEILSHVEAAPGQSIMVGDDWTNDIEGATQAGLHTFWVAPASDHQPQALPGLIGQGPLDSFHRLLTDGEIRPFI